MWLTAEGAGEGRGHGGGGTPYHTTPPFFVLPCPWPHSAGAYEKRWVLERGGHAVRDARRAGSQSHNGDDSLCVRLGRLSYVGWNAPLRCSARRRGLYVMQRRCCDAPAALDRTLLVADPLAREICLMPRSRAETTALAHLQPPKRKKYTRPIEW